MVFVLFFQPHSSVLKNQRQRERRDVRKKWVRFKPVSPTHLEHVVSLVCASVPKLADPLGTHFKGLLKDHASCTLSKLFINNCGFARASCHKVNCPANFSGIGYNYIFSIEKT